MLSPLRIIAWNEQCKLRLYISEKSGWHSLKGTGGRFIDVEGKKMDEVIESLKVRRVDWIKVDVEGSEFEVIEGLQNTLRKFDPRLIVEVTNMKTIQLIKDIGYKCILIPPLTSRNYYCERR